MPQLKNLRSLPRLVVAGAVLLIAGAILVLVSALSDADKSRATGSDRPVNAGAGDLGDISAHNSPTIVRNPRGRRNVIVTNRIDSPDFSCAVHVSRDGGRTWKRTRVPIPPGPGRKCYAPDAAFAPDGTLYVS